MTLAVNTQEPVVAGDSGRALLADVKSWVGSQRAVFRREAVPLDDEQRSALAPYFPASTLDRVRVRLVARLETPPFAEQMAAAGLPLPIDLSAITGLTLIDTIAVVLGRISPENPLLSVLFQECVHVCQYEILGTDLFLDEYVRDWAANGFSNATIPFEQHADELRAKFDARPRTPFSVEAELKRRRDRA